jgi:hypothetical protein
MDIRDRRNTTLFYLDEFADEVMPCAPTLEAWAEWLSKPDPCWGRKEPAKVGEVFAGSTIWVLGDIRAERIDGVWQAVEPVPTGTTSYFLRHGEGSSGWDVEHAGDSIAEAAEGLDDGDSPAWFACTTDGPEFRVSYGLDADGRPTLVRLDGSHG